MLFSVIYSVDVPGDVSLKRYLPRNRSLWDTTEKDDQYEYSYLEGAWEKGKHRKLCAVLNRDQFNRFVSDMSLYPEDVETMGSIGAPGFGYGWAPAIAFTCDDYEAIRSAYVTPIPEVERKREWPEDQERRAWDRIRSAVLAVYG